MRAVAARLEAVPMALYNHFATKEQLVAALLDRVLGRFEPPPPTDDWVEDLRAFARRPPPAARPARLGRRADLLQPEPGHQQRPHRRARAADPQTRRAEQSAAVAAFSGIIAINYGWASFTVARDLDPDGPSHDVEAMLLQLPAEPSR